jgi:5-methylcytosine-specific restriction enzyme A
MRLEFTRKVRAAIIARAAGKCEACSATLKPGEG